jgi:hypothetical protein
MVVAKNKRLTFLIGCMSPEATDCDLQPFPCMVRSSILVLIEIVTLVRRFFFLLPDLVQFNDPGGHGSFQDLDPAHLEALFYMLVNCTTSWIDELDPNSCLTTTPQFVPPGINNLTNLPPQQILTAAPMDVNLNCGNDGLGYRMDGRLFVYQDANSTANKIVTCDTGGTNNCATGYGVASGRSYILAFNGSLPGAGPLNLSVAPAASAYLPLALNVTVTAPDTYLVKWPAGSLAAYGVATINQYFCTNTPELLEPLLISDPLNPGLACHELLDLSVFSTDHTKSERLFRPLENNTVDFSYANMTPVYFNDSGAQNPTSCDYTIYPWVSICPGAGYSVAQAIFHPYASVCTNVVYVNVSNAVTVQYIGVNNTLINTVCRFGQIWHLDSTQSDAYIAPLFIVGFPSSFISCVNSIPPGYVCPGNNVDPFTSGEPEYPPDSGPHFYDLGFRGSGVYVPVTCPLIRIAAAQPRCVDIVITYTSGATVFIEIEGRNIRYVHVCVCYNKGVT